MPETKTCNRVLPDESVCGSSDMAANHSWCKKCNAEYQKSYEKDRLDIMERRGFARGVAAMRSLAIGKCREIGGYGATGHQFAAWIETEKAPEFTPAAD